jgi:D-xylose transport system ATP-binding protein
VRANGASPETLLVTPRPPQYTAAVSGAPGAFVRTIENALRGEPFAFIRPASKRAQTGQVLQLIGRLRGRGLAVVVISHNLEEIYHVADRIVALRLGRTGASFDRRTTCREDVVAAITGATASA